MIPLKIVQADVTALLSLDILDLYQLAVGTALNSLNKRVRLVNNDGNLIYVNEWGVPLDYGKSKHIYGRISDRTAADIYFTRL